MNPSAKANNELRQRLYIALVLNALIVGGEFIGGAWIHSVGLMSDAMHNLIDQGSLFLTLWAHLLAARPSTSQSTFGYHRAGIVTALVNAMFLILAAAGLMVIAVWRLLNPVMIPGGWVIVIALLSFAANIGIALLLQKAAKDDLNIRGAFWHMFGDAWVCLGVAVSGLIILLTHWKLVDPLISFVVVAAVLKGVWPLLKESLGVLMESAPRGLDTTTVQAAIKRIPGVKNVHDLHLWAVKPGLNMLTCHVMVENSNLSQEVLTTVRRNISQNTEIKHITIQLETKCCHPEVIHCDLEQLVSAHGPSKTFV
ncbi:MAG TPA: cation diffusion facilitator family transporter [Nitrospiria bacterium]|nr:cation diffusion facilitator family transporter [Nitrospiria bacterium]